MRIEELLKEKNIDTSTLKEAIIYLVIGVSSVIIDAAIFFILFNTVKIDSIVSTVISISTATIFSFILNSKYNFKKSDDLWRRFAIFSVVSLVGMGISASMIKGLSIYLGMSPNIAKILSLPVIAVVQFLLNKKITFK